MPRWMPRGRRAVVTVVFAAVGLLVLYLLLPQLAGVERTWERIKDGDPGWLALAVACEIASFAGYVWLLKAVAHRDGLALPMRDSWRITLAGVAATRIVTVGGAGGIAVTIVGLRRAGFTTRAAAELQTIDLVLLYAVFFGVMVVDGVVLAVLGSDGGAALSIVPAALATTVILLTLAVALVPATFERTLRRRWGRKGAAIAAVPATLAAGVRGALAVVRRRDPAIVGALAWWGMDMACMWACLRAFGGSVSAPELVMVYLGGHAFNILPLPGGVGPVEGGTIAALAAFGVPGGLALVATLAYQTIAVWLPAIPGAVALLALRRQGPLGPETDDDPGAEASAVATAK